MFKKALQIAVTFAVLIGAHLGYTRGFEEISTRLAMSPEYSTPGPIHHIASSSSIRATELAKELLPEGHWAAQPALPINYYDSEHGFYMYSQSYKLLKGKKQLELRPFAVISASQDGKSHKVITADLAIVDLSQPFLSMKASSAPMKIVHGEMSGNVLIRDDKGTADGKDDLIVGPLTYIEYDEKAAQITSDSDVLLRDRDLTATGKGLLIQLRRKPPGIGGGGMSGFEAESAYLRKKVHLASKDVGATNVLPGKSKQNDAGQVPLKLWCDGEMEILLPPNRPPVAIGPPNPVEPTLAKFQVNVRVVRGTHTPDQLNCDSLLLTLVPTPKPAKIAPKAAGDGIVPTALVQADPLAGTPESAPADAADPAPAPSGPLTELKLREALAQGHAVWIQSESQHLKAKCIELKYKKFTDGTPDETYLNGGPAKRLQVEKLELATTGPDAGSIKKVLRLWSLDATIFDDGQGGASTIVARGPGKAEERPSLQASVEQTAWWEDQLVLRTEAGPAAPGTLLASPGTAPAKGPVRRELTLTGPSKLVDHNRQTTLDAKTKIIARFNSTPKTRPDGPDGPTQIESMQAFDDVNLTAPNKTLVARHQLDVKFEDATPADPAAQLLAANAAPAPAAVPGPAIPVPRNPALASAKVAKPIQDEPDPDAPAKPTPPTAVEPAVDVRANRVWAKILHPQNGGKDEFREARLRGNVMVHQDPAPGKVRGTDASGEALDLMSQGDGLMKFRVLDADPAAAAPKTRLVAGGRAPALMSLARVETQEMSIEGHDIGLDQKADYAEVNGPGKLTEWTERGLLDDKGLGRPKVLPVAAVVPVGSTQARLIITWADQMRFHGKTVDPKGRPTAKAEFRGDSVEVRTPDGKSTFRYGVEARMENALITCEAMDVYTDKPIALNKDARKKDKPEPGAEPEPAAQIALMDCRGNDRMVDDKPKPGVDVISEKYYPNSKDLKEKQRIWSEQVVYDKRTGDFTAPGEGMVYLYKRKGGKGKDPAAPGTISVSGTGGRPANLTPLELIKIAFTEGMQGRFGVAKDKPDAEARVAEFYGNVQAINAMVPHKNGDLDFDKPPSDTLFLTSEYLRVVSAPIGDGKAAQQTLFAKGNAQARTYDRTIQGDRITYDSSNEVAYVYGEEGREVVLIDQAKAGQPGSILRGKSGRYHRTTREASIVDPQTIVFADLKSGIRPKPAPPDLGGSGLKPKPVEQQRVKYFKAGRTHIERAGSTGR
ncbi:hypothetical protein TA3x_005039 [Tundrisphaera sp. TA3]|uniref:hypothetical protein n=1 Tax=Tundrisphaera sp. TA3 TaxID=3435775 RepID=UPI003EBAF18D